MTLLDIFKDVEVAQRAAAWLEEGEAAAPGKAERSWHAEASRVFGYALGGSLNHDAIAAHFKAIHEALCSFDCRCELVLKLSELEPHAAAAS